MTDEFSVAARQENRKTVYRGGEWECKWEESTGEDSKPSQGALVLTPKGEFARVSDGYKGYEPLSDEPTLYLKFAAFGEAVWKEFDGKFLQQHAYDSEISRRLQDMACKFASDYGPVLSLDRRLPLEHRALYTMLRQAQALKLAVVYWEAATGSVDYRELRPYVDEVLDSYRAIKFLVTGIPTSTGYYDKPEYDTTTYEGLMTAAERLLDGFTYGDLGLGGLTLETELVESPHLANVWRFTFSHKALINLIWYQMARAIVNNFYVRICKNERCPRDGRLFETAKPNQYYCDADCRNRNNVRKSFNRKNKLRNLGGILP